MTLRSMSANSPLMCPEAFLETYGGLEAKLVYIALGKAHVSTRKKETLML